MRRRKTYLLPLGPLLCEIRFLLTPLPLSVSSYAACFCLCLFLSVPLPLLSSLPTTRPCLSWAPFPKGPQLQPLSPAPSPSCSAVGVP